jgi:hypothetical protein
VAAMLKEALSLEQEGVTFSHRQNCVKLRGRGVVFPGLYHHILPGECYDWSVFISGGNTVQWWKPALFFLVVIVGLWYVKWQPYYGKAFTAAETHSIGKSILAQADASPLQAAWDYAMVYFLAVWKAAVLGVLLGR